MGRSRGQSKCQSAVKPTWMTCGWHEAQTKRTWQDRDHTWTWAMQRAWSETHEINTRRVLTLSQSAAQIHINRRSHSLNTDSPKIHGCVQQNSAGVTIPHNSDFSWYSMTRSTFTNSAWCSMSVDRFPHQALHDTPMVADKSPLHAMEKSVFSVSSASQHICLVCAACLAVHLWFSFFNMVFIGSNHTLSFISSISCFFVHVLPVRVLCMPHERRVDVFWARCFILIILPSLILKICPLGTFVHEVDSHTCPFYASLISSAHCSDHSDCAHSLLLHMLVHARTQCC